MTVVIVLMLIQGAALRIINLFCGLLAFLCVAIGRCLLACARAELTTH